MTNPTRKSVDSCCLSRKRHNFNVFKIQFILYLKNNLYPEVATVKTLNGGKGLRELESVDTWGVDDGWGYKTGYSYSTANGAIEEVHTYIPQYNQLVWLSSYGGGADPASISRALANLRDAYLYTGDI